MSADLDNKDRARPSGRANPVRLANLLAAALVFLMMLLMVADVAGRELLHQPLPGATELIEICLVGTIFACLPVISWRETHVVADLFDKALGRTGMTIARAFGSLLGAAVFALAGWQIHKLAARALSYNDITPQLELPINIVLEFMAVMCALTALAFAARAVWVVRNPDTPPGASGL